jgi:hypothetical protein
MRLDAGPAELGLVQALGAAVPALYGIVVEKELTIADRIKHMVAQASAAATVFIRLT